MKTLTKTPGLIHGDLNTRQVTINGKILEPNKSQSYRNHSPDGFAWGYGGSGPAQLALAILLEFTDEFNACYLYQSFKFDVIASQDQYKDLNIDIETVENWLEEAKAK